MRKLFLAILFSLLSIAMIVVAAALLVLQFPQILVNPDTLQWAANLAAKEGIHIRWDKLQARAESIDFLRKRIELRFRGLQIWDDDGAFSSKLPTAFISGEIDFGGFVPKVSVLGPVQVKKANLRLNLERASRASGGNESVEGSFRWQREVKRHSTRARSGLLPEFLALAEIRPIRVELAKVNVRLSGHEYAGSITLGAMPESKRGSFRVTALAKTELGGANVRVQADRCRVSGLASHRLHADCHVGAEMKPLPRLGKLNWADFQLPSHTGVTVVADLAPSGAPNGKIVAVLDPILSPLLQGRGKALIDLRPTETTAHVDLRVVIRPFERWVSALAKTDWAIPAPFNVLRGSIELQARGDITPENVVVPVTLTTRLASSTESLDLDGRGQLDLSQMGRASQLAFQIDVSLSKIALELPELKVESPPRILPDTRIERPEKRPVEAEAPEQLLRYRIHVSSPPNSPVLLRSNLAKEPVPIALNLTISDRAPIAGTIRVLNFPVNFFRRDALLDHFDLTLANPPSQSQINGKIQVDYADYKVFVMILGSTEKPQIQLTSNPPLPENQLIAVLLFGRQLDELNDDQTSSVGNTRAAIADGAISLASFYALASTPIESVGYDSRTGLVSAKIRVAEGTSVNIGAGGGNEQIGVRKRLGPHWTLETDLNHPTEVTAETPDIGNTVTAFLEWANRY